MSYVATGVSSARLADIERALWVEKDRAEYSKAGKGIARVQAINAAALITMDAGEGEIRAMAERRAELMIDRMQGIDLHGMKPDGVAEWVNAQVVPMQGRPLDVNPDAIDDTQARRGIITRATDKSYWVKSLRRAVVAMREAKGRASAQVCNGRQMYITDETMRRRINQDAANLAMLERTELENEDGQVFTLADLSKKSTSNPGIRRGELMTRVRGCCEWAQANGMVGIFTTQTAPSRFHAVHQSGVINDKWKQAGKPTPKQGQQWLCKAWARARAELDRRGFGIYGFRVVEPHHDGTPHWHALLWCSAAQVEGAAAIIKKHWLSDCGDEPGAQEHRFGIEEMRNGGAAAYIAKYISKGIDDEGAVSLEGHDDEIQGRVVRTAQSDMFGGGAARVTAWARAHGIRQFQAIGQPPVTVWRELRRVSEAQAVMSSERVHAMWGAAQRKGEERATWARYMARQGGPMVGREYRVAVDAVPTQVEGKYEISTKKKPVGVFDRVEGKRAASDRKEWRPKGAWGSRGSSSSVPKSGAHVVGQAVGPRTAAVPPWTRVNNCTGHIGEIAGQPARRTAWGDTKRLRTWAEIVKEGVKDPFLKPEDERPSHARTTGAKRLPELRHAERHAHHDGQKR